MGLFSYAKLQNGSVCEKNTFVNIAVSGPRRWVPNLAHHVAKLQLQSRSQVHYWWSGENEVKHFFFYVNDMHD